MKPKPCYLFCLLTFIFLLEASATIRYVSKTGSSTPPYTSWATASDSIQKCINICQSGDTVYVANGVYRETLIVNKEIALIGSSMDSTVIDGSGLSATTTIRYNAHGLIKYFHIYATNLNNGSSLSSLDYNVRGDYLKIEGGYKGIFLGASTSKFYYIFFVDNKTAFQSECPEDTCQPTLTNSVIISSPDLWSNSVYFSFGGSPTITNNIIVSEEGNILTGLEVDAYVRPKIENNLVIGFDDQNIGSHNSTLSTLLNNNIASYSKAAGIKLNNGARVKIRNNIVTNNIKGISILNGVPNSDYNLFWENNTTLLGLTYGDSDIVANPMFVKDTLPNSALDFDYHLQMYSPAIDRGDPNILDKDGTRSDMGIYGGPLGEIYTYQDLAPRPPRNLSALVDSNKITLRWNKNTEADTSYYKVYRDTVQNFAIDSTKLISSPADTFHIHSMLPIGQYYYMVTCVDNQGNESRPSEEIFINITAINDYPMTINDYSLYQNYPNPFNPSTTIGYKLKEMGYVKLMVYDIKGELVSVLVNQEQGAGYYEVEFNTKVGSQQSTVSKLDNIASGIYLYRIEVIGEGNVPVYTEMKKMLLIK